MRQLRACLLSVSGPSRVSGVVLTFAFALTFTFLCVPSASAQDSSTAAIRGTVADATGARIPGASVTAQRAATGFTRSVKADNAGAFALDFLPPGEYSVRVEAAQMASEVRSGVHAEVGATVDLH